MTNMKYGYSIECGTYLDKLACVFLHPMYHTTCMIHYTYAYGGCGCGDACQWVLLPPNVTVNNTVNVLIMLWRLDLS